MLRGTASELRAAWRELGRFCILRYLPIFVVLHLAWETLQLPLYTIGTTGTLGERAFAVLHCTLGDLVIGVGSLLAATLMVRSKRGERRRLHIVLIACAFALIYTVYSEWYNTRVSLSWQYADAMPILPLLGTGLSPFIQWLVVPTMTYRIATLGGSRKDQADN